MRVDGGTTIATLLCSPRHCSPRATEDGGGIVNPGLNRYIHHGSEPPRSKLGQTWFIDDEAHLLQNRLIVNSNSSKNRYSGTIPTMPCSSHAYCTDRDPGTSTTGTGDGERGEDVSGNATISGAEGV